MPPVSHFSKEEIAERFAAAIRELEAENAELRIALKAIIGIDNPPAGEPGHVDFNAAIKMGQAAIQKARGE